MTKSALGLLHLAGVREISSDGTISLSGEPARSLVRSFGQPEGCARRSACVQVPRLPTLPSSASHTVRATTQLCRPQLSKRQETAYEHVGDAMGRHNLHIALGVQRISIQYVLITRQVRRR